MLFKALPVFDWLANSTFLFQSCDFTVSTEFFNFTLPFFNFTLVDSFFLDNVQHLSVNFENVHSIYHYSIPVTKLYYPEPFVAMPSFLHYDPWFFHILIYQYWLWFIFIFLVVFFFLMFICTLRWTNLRIKPRRETRGVSRSKCGDLITATVPTTWAGSIIIHESTDAIDFYDGFGTSELVIGIRAFQWGWEYYYPKDMDLNYNLNLNHSFYFGNSLKYSNSSSHDLVKTKYWRFYQLKPTDSIINPINLLLLNSTSFLNLNSDYLNLIGNTMYDESNSFRKIFYASSVINTPVSSSALPSFYNNFFINKNYERNNINNFYVERQLSLLSSKNTFGFLSTLIDLKAFSFFLKRSTVSIFDKSGPDSSSIGGFSSIPFDKPSTFKNHVDVKGFKDDSFVKGVQDLEFLKKEATLRNNLNLKLDFNPLQKSKRASFFDQNVLNKKLNLDFYLPEYIGPVKSTHPLFSAFEFDNSTLPFNTNTSLLVQADDEILSSAYLENFWGAFTANLTKTSRYFLNTDYILTSLLTKWALFSTFADYDFRRWQGIELVEESLFDSVLANSFFNDFFFYNDKFNNYSFITKSYVFDMKNFIYKDRSLVRNKTFKYDVIEKPLKNQSLLNKPYTSLLSFDSTLLNFTSLSRNDYFYISKNYDFFTNIDESFIYSKGLKFFYNMSLNVSFFNTLAFKHSTSALSALDTFKGNLERVSFLPNVSNESTSPLSLDRANDFYSFDTLNRIYSNYNIVYSYKNISNTYDAIQKIFRTKVSEMRSHFKNYSPSLNEVKVPFLTSEKFSYKTISGKHLLGYLNLNPAKFTINNSFNKSVFITNLNNTYFFEFPFSTSVKSDAARYIWSDWFSKWNLVETQASSLAKYGMYGMPHFSKTFDFNSLDSSGFKDSEQYSSRLLQSRKNFSSSWLFTPFFYFKNNTWLKDSYSSFDQNELVTLYRNFYFVKNLYIKPNPLVNYHNVFTSALSGSDSPARNFVVNIDLYSSYNFFLTKLNDILSRREYLVRQLLQNKLQTPYLHKNYVTSPDNTLFQALKSSFNYVLYDFYDADVNRFTYSKFVELNKLNFLWGLNTNLYNNIVTQSPLKSQFRPMKKGIANMVKIHANGAIALPIEMRLQVLASSRDVIHSWAVPSAGIKIDCVPGYSSHRVMIFLLSGIYWGQCMEICGRYHHWMPIIVYFMKRDLFVLWCTHFVFFKDTAANVNLVDGFYTNHLNTVSFDKSSWLSN